MKKNSILVTGGTGFLGRLLIRHYIEYETIDRIVIYSRRWNDQEKMRDYYARRPELLEKLRFITGDIRDRKSLMSAMKGIDIVIHAAAYKHVSWAEYNPREVISVNIEGSQNVIDAAISNGVEQVLAISSDKATDAYNLYGKTKAVMESMMVAANNLGDTRFNVARYGNVWNSTGSVVQKWLSVIRDGKDAALKLTDPNMTRFFIREDQLLDYMEYCLFSEARQGLILLPRMKSIDMKSLALKFIGVAAENGVMLSFEETGIRPGEKMHESLVSDHEAHSAYSINNNVGAIMPAIADWGETMPQIGEKFLNVIDFRSDTALRLTSRELSFMIASELV